MLALGTSFCFCEVSDGLPALVLLWYVVVCSKTIYDCITILCKSSILSSSSDVFFMFLDVDIKCLQFGSGFCVTCFKWQAYISAIGDELYAFLECWGHELWNLAPRIYIKPYLCISFISFTASPFGDNPISYSLHLWTWRWFWVQRQTSCFSKTACELDMFLLVCQEWLLLYERD